MPPKREIVLDIETTGLHPSEGHRLVEIGLVEMVDGKETGHIFHARVNPERSIPARTTKIHGITDDMVADKPTFAAIAQQIKDFIGDATIVITCRTDAQGHTLDMEFMKAEMIKAGFSPYPPSQWLNVRRWSEALFGHEGAKLDNVLDHYKIDRTARGYHGALLDAQLLAQVYPLLSRDYAIFLQQKKPPAPAPEM